jgi:hypothetical protein
MTDAVAVREALAEREREELWREAAIMTLYLSIVLLATLAAVPDDNGPSGWELIALVWSESIGLVLAHYFAFRVVATGFGGGKRSRHDLNMILCQLAGGALVASTTTIPILLAGHNADVRAAAFAPAFFVGVGGWAASRSGGASHPRSMLIGAVVLGLGLAIAGFKAALTH